MAYRQARNARLFKIERATMRIAGECVYVMDSPRSFRRDPSDVPSGPRISEMMAVGLDRLIVLERTEQTAKLREIELAGATDIAGSKGDDAANARKSSWFAAPASRGASLRPIRKRLA